jgi:isopentenyl-diphosphate delta-isomerase
VFCGYSNKIPKINTDEVCDYRYINKQNLELELKQSPEIYTKWFKICYKQALKNLEQKKILNVF